VAAKQGDCIGSHSEVGGARRIMAFVQAIRVEETLRIAAGDQSSLSCCCSIDPLPVALFTCQ
jgi:hypothetical protein